MTNKLWEVYVYIYFLCVWKVKRHQRLHFSVCLCVWFLFLLLCNVLCLFTCYLCRFLLWGVHTFPIFIHFVTSFLQVVSCHVKQELGMDYLNLTFSPFCPLTLPLFLIVMHYKIQQKKMKTIITRFASWFVRQIRKHTCAANNANRIPPTSPLRLSAVPRYNKEVRACGVNARTLSSGRWCERQNR